MRINCIFLGYFFGALVCIGAITSLLSLFLRDHFNNCAFNYLETNLSLV